MQIAARQSRRRLLRSGLALAGLGLAAGCGLAPPRASQPAKAASVGLLAAYSLDPSPEITAFRQALRDLGYSEGQNLTLVPRYGSGREALASRAAELIDAKVNAIVAVEDESTRAAAAATKTIPIVMADSTDPVADGLVGGLGRPGGNITGLTNLAGQLRAKRLDLLKEAVPGLSRVAVVWVSNTDESPDLRELEATAGALGVQLSRVTARSGGNLASPFADTIRSQVDGLLVLTDAYARMGSRQGVTRFAAEKRLPAMYEARSMVEAGGLMAYGPNQPDMFRQAATYVDKILRGANPADLPVEQPTTFEFVINLRTAQALGLTIPPAILQQATEIIQ